jgi:hypothetical protein
MKALMISCYKTAPALYFAIAFIVAFALISITAGATIYNSYMESSYQYKEKTQKMDHSLDFEDISGITSDPNSLSALKNAYELISQSSQIEYCEIQTQPLYFFDYSGAEKYEYGYEAGIDATQTLQFPTGIKTVSAIKSCQLSKNAFSLFDLSTSEGRILEDADYIFESETAVPVILGFEFADTYNIGDTFECDYLGLNIKAKVVGILNKDSYITRGSSMLFLDRYIVLPMFNCIEEPEYDSDYYSFQCIHYLNKLSGVFYTNERMTSTEISAMINSMVGSVLPKPIKVWEIANPFNVGAITIDGESQAKIIKNCCYIIAAVLVGVSCILTVRTKKKTAYTIAAFICSGASSRNVQEYFFIAFLLVTLLGSCLATIVCTTLFRTFHFYSASVIFLLSLTFFQSLLVFGNQNWRRMLKCLQSEDDI